MAIARRKGITRTRVTQVMGMLRFAPEIRENILYMAKALRRPFLTERVLRSTTTSTDHRNQLRQFHELLEQESVSG